MKAVQYYDAGLEQFPLRGVVLGNLAMALLIAAGTIACWLISPALGIAYAVLSAGMVFVVLRRLVCTRCYYYGKRCGIGWGLLAARFFARGKPEEFNDSAGIRLAPAVYGLVTVVPLIALAVLLLRGATTTAVVLTAAVLAIGVYSSGPGRRQACAACKMRLFCRGCAAK